MFCISLKVGYFIFFSQKELVVLMMNSFYKFENCLQIDATLNVYPTVVNSNASAHQFCEEGYLRQFFV